MKKAVVFMLLCMLLGCTAAQTQETPYLGGE